MPTLEESQDAGVHFGRYTQQLDTIRPELISRVLRQVLDQLPYNIVRSPHPTEVRADGSLGARMSRCGERALPRLM
jgi:hypothetical protein